MSAASGWYDDPRDPLLLRYWDGVLWTDHTAPKTSPTAAASHIGEAHHVPTPAQNAGHDQRPTYAQPVQPGAGQPGSGQPGSGQPGAGQAPSPQSGYPGAPQWQQPRSLGVVTTPDGAETSGWWKRVVARILDGLIVSVVSLPLTGYFYLQYFHIVSAWLNDMMNRAAAGQQSMGMMLPSGAYRYLIPAAVLQLVVYAVYEVLFVTRLGATPGKMAVGISIRLREVAGRPPALAVLRRFAVFQGPSLLALIPVIGTLFTIFQVVDSLWPLWDRTHQALHDKVGATNVVLGPQLGRAPGGSALEDRPADQIGSGTL